MAKRRLAITALALCFLICLVPCTAFAAFTTDAIEPILTENDCTLTLSYRYDCVAFSGCTVKLYRIADVSADAVYTPVPAFAGSGLVLNGIQTNGEWKVIRSTLESHILANNTEPALTAATDSSGQVCFTGLKPGMYLVSALRGTQGGLTCSFQSALIALPGLDTDGHWQYQISTAPKPEVIPPKKPDADIQFKVLKLWKGDVGFEGRPTSIEVELFRDGSIFETVVLSEENNWAYSWTADDDGSSWSVVERNIPEGYSVTLEERGTAFVLTNTLIPPDPENPEDPEIPPVVPPKTGDTSNIHLYAVLMFASGSMLIILGITGKRTDHEDTP